MSTDASVLADGRVVLLVNRPEDVTDFVLARDRTRLAEERGEQWRVSTEHVEADLFAQTQALTAALAARERAAAQAAALAEVALAPLCRDA